MSKRNCTTGILEVETDVPYGPVIKRDVSTSTNISKTPLIPDAWEFQVSSFYALGGVTQLGGRGEWPC